MENLSQSLLEDSHSALLPSLFFPPIAYFQYLLGFNKAYIEAFETFEKQTLRNRTYILSANGVECISVPLVKEKNRRLSIQEMQICYTDHWEKKAWRTITSAYGKSPYFEYFEEDIHHFFSKDYLYLWQLNNDILSYFLKRFHIQTKVLFTSEFEKSQKKENDSRLIFNSIKIMDMVFTPDCFLPYTQCFCNKFPFTKNLSCLDLLFMAGGESSSYLKKNQ